MEDLPETPFVKKVLEQHDRRRAAVVVPNHVRDFGGFDRFDHHLRLSRVASQRFLAHHNLAREGGGDGDLGMRVIRAGDVDKVNVFALDQLTPIRLDRLVTPVVREGLRAIGIARADSLQRRLNGKIKETSGLQKRVRMSASHETIADQTDIQLFFCHNLLSINSLPSIVLGARKSFIQADTISLRIQAHPSSFYSLESFLL